ncbi:gp53-like domain-containing protein [Burkholderia arboris]|uniref:gp53-like domain-containing protein n=1 Tax=Burkholderia arboris TaxID=488730 RepID=UPI00210C80F9|nr:hypothetical protein [Burkholderia arboris]UTV56181.1 hypothetical protein NLX30_07330 [Burkholderia arboris]
MDYTTSIDNVVHGGTGHRMHSDSIAVPTAWSGNDANMVVWSLMEVLRLAGVGGKAFNPDDPVSYTRFRDALIATFAGLDSPAFRGAPQAPLAPQFDNSTRLATSSFVQRAIGSLSGVVGIGSSTTLTAANYGNLVICNGTAAMTVTLPAASSAGQSGPAIHFLNQEPYNVTVRCAGNDNIVGGSLVVPSTLVPNGGTLTLASNGLNWYVAGGTAGMRFAQRVLINTNNDDGSSALQISGVATAFSPPQFDVSKKLATTEFVQRAIGSYSGISVISSASTLTASSTGKVIELNGNSTFTTTLPDGTTVTEGGKMAFINQSGVSQSVAVQGNDSIWSWRGGKVSSMELQPGDSLELFSRVGQWDICGGSASLQFSMSFGAAPNYQLLPGGLIMQWGQTPVVAGAGVATINYPIAFTKAFYGCIPMGGKISANQTSNLILNSLGGSLTQFQAVNTGASQVDGGCYFAWGK